MESQDWNFYFVLKVKKKCTKQGPNCTHGESRLEFFFSQSQKKWHKIGSKLYSWRVKIGIYFFSKSKKNAQNRVQIILMESQDWNFFFSSLKVPKKCYSLLHNFVWTPSPMFKFSLKLGIVAMQSHSLHSVLSYTC